MKAAPARHQPQTITQPDGSTITLVMRGDEWHHWLTDLDGQLMIFDEATGFYRLATDEQRAEWQDAAQRQAQRRAQANIHRAQRRTASNEDNHFAFPSKGKVRGLVVLVEYQDVKFSIEEPLQTYTDMMNKDGFDYAASEKYVHHGSAHDYFYQNSMGQFDPEFDVFGPLTLKNDRAYYGSNDAYGNDKHAHEMIIEACEQLDSLGVDFTQYDNNHDGQIDFVFAFFAGEGENATRISYQVWPHAWDMASAGEGGHYFDDMQLMDYACTCELYKSKLDGVGTFCHEFSHVLGLPDLYDINYRAEGAYDYSVLDNGCYALRGYCPVGYSAYERYELGWLTPTQLPDSAATISLNDFGSTNQAYIQSIGEKEDPREGEYYLFENRQNCGWDAYLPGHGMLVWHIDYVGSKWNGNTVNTWTNHQCVDLVEADGYKHDQNGSETFPGIANHTAFTDDTMPAFCGWSQPGTSSKELGIRIGKPITEIQEIVEENGNQIITFNLNSNGTEQIRDVVFDTVPFVKGITIRNGAITVDTATNSFNLWGQQIK